MRPGSAAAAMLALTASLAAASTADHEQALARVTAERDRVRAERKRLAAEAALAADAVATRPGAATARADEALSRRLREFDRLARRLDDVESRLAELERRRARARADFEAAADAEERRLLERARRDGAAAAAPDLAALAAIRRRVSQSEAEAAFRPPLDVALDPMDGPAELEAKLAILAGEQERAQGRLQELSAEDALLAARIAARRESAREIGAARREGAGTLDLLDRGYEDVRASLRALEAAAGAVAGERARLEAAVERLAARRAQVEERLASLRKGR